MKTYVRISALAAFGLVLVLADLAQGQQAPPNPLAAMTPVTDEMLKNPPAGDWLMWRRTYDAWGYSTLDQINKDNVENLRVAWTWSLASGVTEIAPLVHDGVLFVWNWGDKVQALNAATGDLLWEYRRGLPQPLFSRGVNTLARRNMALYGDKLIIATSDATLVALEAKSGKILWSQTVADWKEGWSYTGGPFIAGGKV